MDFITETFPETRLHIALYKLAEPKSNLVDFPDKQSQNRLALQQIQKKYQSSISIVNAQFIVSLTHLNIAVSKSLINRRDAQMKSNCIGNEIVYQSSPSKQMD
jgi:tRNA threonylcarbamoyladenosine modification (KEOPS) complex Cgi121 subunit